MNQDQYGKFADEVGILINAFYMNIPTGRVDTGLGWVKDFYDQTETEFWEEWGGTELIEVAQDDQGRWINVE